MTRLNQYQMGHTIIVKKTFLPTGYTHDQLIFTLFKIILTVVPILNPELISIFTSPIHPQSKECVLRIFTKHSENPSVDVMLIFPCKVQWLFLDI